MNNRFYKVVVGLTIQSSIRNKRFNQFLFNIYSNPSLDAIRLVYDQLVVSDNHLDIAAAFWLEPALQKKPVQINLPDLIVEMKEIEVLLFDIICQADPVSHQDLNDWANYIANVGLSLQDRYIIDAKILMNLAVQSSRRESIEKIKRNLDLRYRVEVLQKETLRCFEELKKLPFKLVISEERLDALIEVQDILIDLLYKYYLNHMEQTEFRDFIRDLLQKLNAAQRYLLRYDSKNDRSKYETARAFNNSALRIKSIKNKNNRKWAERLLKKIQDLLTLLS